MQDDPLISYLGAVESAFGNLENGYIERYEEEILTPGRVNIRIRVRFPNGQILEWNEAVIILKGNVDHLCPMEYIFHSMGAKSISWGQSLFNRGNIEFRQSRLSKLNNLTASHFKYAN